MNFTHKTCRDPKSPARYFCALLGCVALALSGTSLRAEMDISASQNGAFVLYSSPLNKDVQPQKLLNGKFHSKPFLPGSTTPMLVIDLSKTYKLTDLRNLPVNAHTYLLNRKPKDEETWKQLLDPLPPEARDGSVGQYLVIVFNENPPTFSDPLVDGEVLWHNDGSIMGSGFGLGNSIPLAITPLTSTEIISH